VLLTDHDMPEMDGLMLAARVRAAGHRLPIVLLSSNPAGARDRERRRAHVDAFLQKPVLRAELYRRLEDLVGPVADEAPPATAAPAAPIAQRQMRVLAAEDNKTNQLVFQKMVKGIDIELRFANNGREAVEMWQTFRPDLIFMDISMPEMDGKEATRAIRAAEADARRMCRSWR
jgi:CheY-like chemotaxis protein